MARLPGMGPKPEIPPKDTKPNVRIPTFVPEKKPVEDPDYDNRVFEKLKELAAKDSYGRVKWDEICLAVEPECKLYGNDHPVEDALNRLMDRGMVYEPTLGILKVI